MVRSLFFLNSLDALNVSLNTRKNRPKQIIIRFEFTPISNSNFLLMTLDTKETTIMINPNSVSKLAITLKPLMTWLSKIFLPKSIAIVF